MRKRNYDRSGQLWWQDYWAPHLRKPLGRWIIVLRHGKSANPVVHTVLASRDGKLFLADVTEHHLRKWEDDKETLTRVG